MPTSRSPSRGIKPDPPSHSYWPLVLIGLAAVLAVVIAILPASLVGHFLPAFIHAEDYSGSLWHGSAGKISVNARDAGALEWSLHPLSLLGMSVVADLHWVKMSFVADATVKVDRHGYTAHAVKGGGPIEDLRDFGVSPGWRGIADFDFSELKGDFATPLPLAAVGDLRVSNLMLAQVAGGADLGSYDLSVPQGAVDADGNATAKLVDTGGPLDLQALIHYSAKDHTGVLTGTLKERAGAPAALISQINNIAQMRGRDSQGRVPVDLELAL
jgi:Type II secretion system (T2SS), protein N